MRFALSRHMHDTKRWQPDDNHHPASPNQPGIWPLRIGGCWSIELITDRRHPSLKPVSARSRRVRAQCLGDILATRRGPLIFDVEMVVESNVSTDMRIARWSFAGRGRYTAEFVNVGPAIVPSHARASGRDKAGPPPGIAGQMHHEGRRAVGGPRLQCGAA
jgi:hypothetical protein